MTDDDGTYLGLAAYFDRALWRVPERHERIASLLVDARWPWVPWWVSFTGVHKRDDRKSVRVGGTTGTAPLLAGFASPQLTNLELNRTSKECTLATVLLDLGRNREDWGWEAPFRLWITARCADLPAGKSVAEWLTLAHDLVSELGVIQGTVGVWPTHNMAIGDTWLTRTILDTPQREFRLGLPENFATQIDLLQRWKKLLGRTYARHPRWGTYLNAAHVAAIGGEQRIREEVEPAQIRAVGELTYIQLTDSVETALTQTAGEKRRRLEALMAPIILGAGRE